MDIINDIHHKFTASYEFISDRVWIERIERLYKGDLSIREINDFIVLAESWKTCAISCVDKRVHRIYTGRPVDDKLHRLGVRFAEHWNDAAESSYRKYIIVHLLDCISEINNRCGYILNNVRADGAHKKIAQEYTIYLQLKTSRKGVAHYYPKVCFTEHNNYYIFYSRNSGEIELLNTSMRNQATRFYIESEATDFIEKHRAVISEAAMKVWSKPIDYVSHF